MKRALLIFGLAFILLVISIRHATARWYAGNRHDTGYGAKAVIYTPSSAVQLIESGSSGESSWVSLPPPYWIQAGWRYYWSNLNATLSHADLHARTRGIM